MDEGSKELVVIENKDINELFGSRPFEIGDDALWFIGKQGASAISNFIMVAKEKINYIDDRNGKNTKTMFKIEGILLEGKGKRARLSPLTISENEYKKCDFILSSCWSKDAIVFSGTANHDRLREATQHISRYFQKDINIYSVTGFKEIDGNLVYLYHNGYIGNAENIQVDLSEDGLERFCFTDKNFPIKQALNRSLSYLEIADYAITIPILATIYTAPLYSILVKEGIFADFIVFIEGKTGSLKSSSTAVALSHYGKFDRDHFPCNFRENIAPIEKKASILKDTVNVVDDHNPEKYDGKHLAGILGKLYAMYGDKVGKMRMSPNGRTLKLPYIAKGLCIVTGETRLDGNEGRTARTLIINIGKNSIDKDKLAELQNNTDELAFAMMKYIEWIIINIEHIKENAKKILNSFDISNKNEIHGRTIENVKALKIGFTFFTEFLKDNEVINNEEKILLDNKASEVLIKLVEQQTVEIDSEKPSNMFFAALEELIQTQKVYLMVQDETGKFTEPIHDFRGQCVGYCDNESFYFMPGTIYTKISAYYNSMNEKFPMTRSGLWRHLLEDGYLYRTDPTRYTISKIINGSKETVVSIRIPEEFNFKKVKKEHKDTPHMFGPF